MLILFCVIYQFSMKVVLLFLVFLFGVVVCSNKRVLVWMCLEVCGGNDMSIASNLQQIQDNSDILSSVAFEKYNLGPNSTLVANNLTEVSSTIQSFGLETWPMVSSYPYPPQFIVWMREVFKNPQPFIDSCISEAQYYGYTGFNIDWEPVYGATSEDAILYADFINTLSTQLHQHNIKVSVDFATWSAIWNVTALAGTSVDYMIDMSTYTNSDVSFASQLELAVEEVGIDKLGVGLETVNAETGVPLRPFQVQWRINQIESYSCNEIDIWDEPIPEFWWDLLADFVNS